MQRNSLQEPKTGKRDAEGTLRRIPLFSGLSDDEFVELARRAEFEVYARGQEILGQEDNRDGLFIVLEGRARLYRMLSTGDEVTVVDFWPGDIFGLSFLVSEIAQKNAFGAVADGTALYHLPRRDVEGLFRSHPPVASRVLDLLGQRLARVADRYVMASLYRVDGRLAHRLEELARRTDNRSVHDTHHELAVAIGASEAEVSRTLRKFREAGYIESIRGRPGIRVLNLAPLLQ